MRKRSALQITMDSLSVMGKTMLYRLAHNPVRLRMSGLGSARHTVGTVLLARPRGFELPTIAAGGSCSSPNRAKPTQTTAVAACGRFVYQAVQVPVAQLDRALPSEAARKPWPLSRKSLRCSDRHPCVSDPSAIRHSSATSRSELQVQISDAPFMNIDRRHLIFSGVIVRQAGYGIMVSAVSGAGAAMIANNLISGAKRGAIVGMEWAKAVTVDLTAGSSQYPQLVINGNKAR
jgi:hypothetical protein